MTGKLGCNLRKLFIILYISNTYISNIFQTANLGPVCILVYMYGYQCMVKCFPVTWCKLIANRWDPQTTRAYNSLTSIFLEIRKNEKFWILSLESIASAKTNHKSAKGRWLSNQSIVTSPHIYIHRESKHCIVCLDIFKAELFQSFQTMKKYKIN